MIPIFDKNQCKNSNTFRIYDIQNKLLSFCMALGMNNPLLHLYICILIIIGNYTTEYAGIEIDALLSLRKFNAHAFWFREKVYIRYLEYVVYLSFKTYFNHFAYYQFYIKVQNHEVDKLMILIPWKKFSPFEHQHTLKWQCRYIIRNFPHNKDYFIYTLKIKSRWIYIFFQ